MECPKCKATIGVHLSQYILLTHSDAFGLHCYICGYWMNLERGWENSGTAKTNRMKVRGRRAGKTQGSIENSLS
ncbi:MAG: hypothetical protein ED859_06305 [Desulfuromonadales bacterium]|nr:MAG: hypothetical protein ED859_06305 [Desulfuromonadales bacterium]